MINTTDFAEFEVLLPGTWVRTDSGAIYSFSNDQMSLKDERLFKELYITEPGGTQPVKLPYAVTIEDDYFGVLVDDQEFTITSITRHPDGSMDMEWKDRVNTLIPFHRNA